MRPEKKRLIGIDTVHRSINVITLYTFPFMVEILSDFGTVIESKTRANHYTLIVDRRYDFDEVLDYIGDT